MKEQYTDLSSYMKRKSREYHVSREYRSSTLPDHHEEENMILAMAVALGVSISLVTALFTVFFVTASTY